MPDSMPTPNTLFSNLRTPLDRHGRRRPVTLAAALVCAIAFGLWLGPAAHAETKPVPAQVRALHRLARLDGNVASFCATLIETAELTAGDAEHPTMQKLDPAARSRWLAHIRNACEPARATEQHLRAFAADYDAEAARAVTDWYTSETGAKLLALEAEAAETDWDAEVMPFVDRIMKEPVPIERVELFERIDAALQPTEDAALLQAGIGEILTWSIQPLLPEADRTPRGQIDQELAALRLHYEQQMGRQQSVVFMFVYRDASEEELAAFADFSESKSARWLNACHRMAMLQLIAELREELVASLGGV